MTVRFRPPQTETSSSSSSSSSSDSDEGDDHVTNKAVDGVDDDFDDLDDLGRLVIDESPPASIAGATIDENSNVEVIKAQKGVEVDQTSTFVPSRGIRGRTRSRSRAISASAAELDAPMTPSGAPQKRSRSQSQSRRQRSCSPLKLPDPPGPQPNRKMEEKALKEYQKKVAKMSKAYLVEHANHNCFGGGRPESLRPINCVGRGGLSMRSLDRWTRGWGGRLARDGGYAEGYYDEDEDYYADPNKLNPPKRQKGTTLSVRTGVTDPTSSQAGPSTAVVPMDMDACSTGADDNVVVEYRELSPILKVPRSFENRPRTRLSEGGGRRVRVNIAGIMVNVIDDRNPITGQMEDRRSAWTIERNIAAAELKDAYDSMSDDEYAVAKEEKKRKKARKAAAKAKKLEPQRLRALHANQMDSIVRGDRYIGGQQDQIDDVTNKMSALLVKQTKEWTTPRLGGQSRPSLKWIDCVDRVVDIDGGYVGNFSSKDPGLHPIDDITLIRAKVSHIHESWLSQCALLKCLF